MSPLPTSAQPSGRDALSTADGRTRLRAAVQRELDASALHEARGNFATAFRHLERAHVLGQRLTRDHVRVHLAMWRFARRQRDGAEALGQLWRIAAAALKTAPGWVPAGNTGGAGVPGWRRLPIPADLQAELDAAGRPAAG